MEKPDPWLAEPNGDDWTDLDPEAPWTACLVLVVLTLLFLATLTYIVVTHL